MLINQHSIYLRLHDPLNQNLRIKNSLDISKSFIVEDIIMIQIDETVVEKEARATIDVPFTIGFLFHNDIAYKYVEFIRKIDELGNEETIFWAKVDDISTGYTSSEKTTRISCSSFSDTYNHATVDHQIYNKATIKYLLSRNAELICNDSIHGSSVSIMSKKDIIFVPKTNDYNPQIDSLVREMGSRLSSTIDNILSKASLYMFSVMHNQKPKIIINSLPVLPNNEYGFGTNVFANTLAGEYVDDVVQEWNVDNIKSFDFSADYTTYRDRIRLFVDDGQEIWNLNQMLEELEIDRITSTKIKLRLAPFVPQIISREYLSASEGRKILDHLWNSLNHKTAKFELSIAGWQLLGEEPKIGMILNFSFRAASTYIDPTGKDNNTKKQVVYQIPGVNSSQSSERMVIVNTSKIYSKEQGFYMKLTLVEESTFFNEPYSIKKRLGIEETSSYYTGYEGRADG